MRRLGVLFAYAALASTIPATGLAADATLTTMTPEGREAVLQVRDTGATLCHSIAVGGEAPKRTAPCAAAPANPREDVAAVHVVYRASPEKLTIVYGVLSEATARLQLRFEDGRPIELVPDGERRAYLYTLHGRPALATARAVDAANRTLAAVDVDPRAVRLKPRRGPVKLLPTRDERGRLGALVAFSTPLLAPGRSRRARAVCVAVEDARRIPATDLEPGYSGGSACAFKRSSVAAKFAAGCAANRLLLFGLAPTLIKRFSLVTRTGRRVKVETVRVPTGISRGLRAFLVSRRDPGRLSRLEAYARSGKRLVSVSLTSVGSACGSSSRS